MLPNALFVVAVILIAASVVALLRRGQSKPHCPYCNSTKIEELDRKTLASRMQEFFNGGFGGAGDIRLQLDLELTYRCQACAKTFKRQVRQT